MIETDYINHITSSIESIAYDRQLPWRPFGTWHQKDKILQYQESVWAAECNSCYSQSLRGYRQEISCSINNSRHSTYRYHCSTSFMLFVLLTYYSSRGQHGTYDWDFGTGMLKSTTILNVVHLLYLCIWLWIWPFFIDHMTSIVVKNGNTKWLVNKLLLTNY